MAGKIYDLPGSNTVNTTLEYTFIKNFNAQKYWGLRESKIVTGTYTGST
jgi:hypothetical protein